MDQQENLTNTDSAGLLRNRDGEFIAKVVRMSWILLFVTSLFQVLFFWSIDNILAIGAVYLGWVINTKIFLRHSMIEKYPFSTFLIIAFISTQLYFPLLFTSIEYKPLIYNLELPEEVFLHTILAVIVVSLAHSFYRLLSRMSNRESFSLMTKLGFFDPPQDIQLWLMGIAGLGASVYVYFVSPDIGYGVTTGSSFDKLIQGLMPFSYAPFFIPFRKLYGNNKKPSRRLIPMLVLFMVALFIVSIGRNSRGAFMFGFTSVAFAYALGLLLGVYKTRLFTLKNTVVAVFFAWLLVGPMADLGTAMLLVRGEREDISAVELVEQTFEAYGDKEAIRARQLDITNEAVDTEWDERYLDNIFTARFANIKFNDMSLLQAAKLRHYDPDMLSFSIDFVLCALPEPFMKALNIDADKELIYSISIGDYLFLVAGGYGYDTGFRSGHFAGTGLAAFGWWYLFLLGIGMIAVFFLFDKFSKRIRPDISSGPSGNQKIQFSLCGMLALTSIFQFLPNESVAVIGAFLLRGWIQMALLYFLMFHLTRIASGRFLKR